MTKFAELRATYGPKIDAQLAQDLKQITTDAQFSEMMAYAVLNGGKRLRPLLTLAVISSFQQTITPQALKLATSVEWVHSYSLVHDDLPAMDNDLLRRGQPSVHAKFGEAAAILVGDALLTGAFEVVTTANTLAPAETMIPDQTIVTIVQNLAHFSGAAGMVIGQMHDMANHGQNLQTATDWLLQEIYTPKTAALIQFSAQLGAQLATLHQTQVPEVTQAMAQFGLDFGLAFQIQDDLDDFEQDDTATIGALPHLIGVSAARTLRDRYLQDANDRLTQLTTLVPAFDRTLLDDFLTLIGD